ncbi:MAG: hypothetical protein GKR89_14140 [Candidatus Latescibacteria bacterium]|nr:hypothetical protein [Candidatus Latescibacterota bacterium]
MAPIRTVVSGLGRIGWQFHLPNLQRHEGFELVGVIDPLAERLQEAADEYGGVAGYADLATCLAAQKPQLLVLTAPTPFHMEQCLAAFASGCDVFCEKPLAADLAQADRMIAAMRRQKRKLMVYQPHRATTETVSLRQVIGRGLIGPVYMIKSARSAFTRRNDWQAFSANGGGMLNNYGAHIIDQWLYVCDSSAAHISAKLRTVASLGDADDVVKAVIETESGVLVDIDINMAAAHSMTPCQVLGPYGSIVLDTKEKAWQVRYFDPAELAALEVQEGLAASNRRYGSGEEIPWREETVRIADFAPVDFYQKVHGYFGGDEAPFVPIAQTREVMRVLETCRAGGLKAKA